MSSGAMRWPAASTRCSKGAGTRARRSTPTRILSTPTRSSSTARCGSMTGTSRRAGRSSLHAARPTPNATVLQARPTGSRGAIDRRTPPMLAAFYERPGAARDVLQLATLPDPQPQAGEVRVRMRWSGVNPSDVKSRAGSRGPTLPFPRIIPHSDGMGVIEAVGPGVATTRVGKRVWLWNAAWGRAGGTAAQFTCVPAEQAVTLPDDAPDEAGACLGIPALTALHAVLTDGGVAGQRVLVAAGAGAVGHYAVQFAKLLGARQVLATASTPAKQALARDAGADFVADYREAGAAEHLRAATQGQGVDRIVEMDVAANAALNLAVMRPGATWAVYGSGAREFQLPFFPLI